MRETWVRSLGWEDPLEEGMATHCSILAWRIPVDRGAWQAIVKEWDTAERLSIAHFISPTCENSYVSFPGCIQDIWMSEWKSLSHVWLFVTPLTIQSVELSRSEYWSGEPFPSPGDLPNPGIEHRSPALQVDSLPAEPQVKPHFRHLIGPNNRNRKWYTVATDTKSVPLFYKPITYFPKRSAKETKLALWTLLFSK